MNAILLLILLTISTFCTGQNKQNHDWNTVLSPKVNIGEEVLDIGKNIDCILQDHRGGYWFASNGEGVFHYNGKILKHITVNDGLISNFVLKIEQDKNGTMWFSTRDGICSFNGTAFTDQTYAIRNAPKGTLRYTPGGLFFGHLNGICFFDGLTFTNFVIHPDTYIPSPSNMNRPYSVYSTLVDRAGNVWFGTQSQGVCRYDGRTFTYFTEKNLAGPAVRTLFQDKAGDIWFGNNGGGLFRYDGKKLTNLTEEKGLGNPEFLQGKFKDAPGSLARVWTLNDDNEGNLLIGTIDAGMWKYNGTHLKNYTAKEGLPGDAVWSIFKDNNRKLWFIVNGESICHFDGKRFTKFSFR